MTGISHGNQALLDQAIHLFAKVLSIHCLEIEQMPRAHLWVDG